MGSKVDVNGLDDAYHAQARALDRTRSPRSCADDVDDRDSFLQSIRLGSYAAIISVRVTKLREHIVQTENSHVPSPLGYLFE